MTYKAQPGMLWLMFQAVRIISRAVDPHTRMRAYDTCVKVKPFTEEAVAEEAVGAHGVQESQKKIEPHVSASQLIVFVPFFADSQSLLTRSRNRTTTTGPSLPMCEHNS